MKPYLPFKRIEMPFHRARPFSQALKQATINHGYKGPFAQISFLFDRNKDHWLQVLSRIVPYNGLRIKLQRARGVKIGKKVHLGPMVTIDDVYPYFVKIEDGVSISGQCFIIAHSIPDEFYSEATESFVAPVIIKKNVWLAVNVVIFPGVTIGEGSIVAAGSVVSKPIPPFVLAAGTPAVVKKDISGKVKNKYSEKEFVGILDQRMKDFGI